MAEQTKQRFGAVLPIVLLGYFLILMDNSVVFSSSLSIARELGNNLLAGAKFTASDTRSKPFGPAMMGDGNWETYWAPSDGTTSADIAIKTKGDVTLDCIMLQEYIPLGQRVKEFVIEYKTCCGKWVPVIVDEETTTIGYKRLVRFNKKTASEWRIRILDSRACPCINNIEGFLTEDKG